MASMRLETVLTIRGVRQGKTRHAPKIKSITVMSVLNPPKVENNPPNNYLGFQPFHTCMGTCAIFLILVAISNCLTIVIYRAATV
jgi:hypothetical protein